MSLRLLDVKKCDECIDFTRMCFFFPSSPNCKIKIPQFSKTEE